MQVWNVLQEARCKCRTQKSRQKSPSEHHSTTSSGYIFATKACIHNRKKNLLSGNISPSCPHNMVNFGPLAAEIISLVCGTPGNFNGFRVLAVLLHGTLVVGVSQTVALNRGRHLYSAGRPSRWALAHISGLWYFARHRSNEINYRGETSDFITNLLFRVLWKNFQNRSTSSKVTGKKAKCHMYQGTVLLKD